MYAQITIIGNVGQTPELRSTINGTPVCNFSVAVNRVWKDSNGEQKQQVTWYRIVAWQRQAEICHEHLKQGDRVMIVSENIESVAWTDRDGKAHSSIQLVPRTVKFLSPHSGNEDTAAISDENESIA